MTASYSSPWSGSAGRAYWLPPWGTGNGLESETWAAIADADESEVRLLLDALRVASIPAHAARRAGYGLDGPFRIWVGTWYYSRAEDVIGRVLRGRR